MRKLRKQRGITMMGLVFVGIVVGFIGFVALKLIPFYQENSGVQRALQQLKEMPEVKQLADGEITEKLLDKLYKNDVRNINRGNFEQHFVIEPTDSGYVLKVNYAREAPLFANLFIVAKFQQDFKL